MKCGTVLCIGMLAGSLPAQQPPVKGFNLYTPEREIRLGREAAYNLEHTLPLVRVSRLDDYLAKVATALSEQAGYSLPFRFTVFDDRKPFTAYPGELAMPVDAFGSKEPVALPGGFIFVPLSLLRGRPRRDGARIPTRACHGACHTAPWITAGDSRATGGHGIGRRFCQGRVRAVGHLRGKELASRLLGLRYARSLELEADRAAAEMLRRLLGTTRRICGDEDPGRSPLVLIAASTAPRCRR